MSNLQGAESPIELTKAIIIACAIGVLVGMILSKLYSIFLHYLFGIGHLKGHSDERFGSTWVETTQGKVRLVRYGADSPTTRPLAVLVHGYAGSLDVFADPTRSNLCRKLEEEGFEVLAFDLYGHGGSDCPDTHFSAELFASQLAEICISFNIRQPFVLIAHSMGSSVAVTFAHRYPSFVSRLVLICPSIADVPMELKLRFALRIPFFREVLSYFIIPTFGEGTNENNAGMLRACYRLLETRLHNGGSWNAGDTKALSMLSQLMSSHLSEPGKVLILWGQEDRVVPFQQARVLASVAGEAGFCVLKQADHMCKYHTRLSFFSVTNLNKAFADGPTWMREYFQERIVWFVKEDTSFITSTIASYFAAEEDGAADVDFRSLDDGEA